MRKLVVLLVAISSSVASVAFADPPPLQPTVDVYVDNYFAELQNYSTADADAGTARLGFLDNMTKVDAPYEGGAGGGAIINSKNKVVAWSADKRVAWASAGLELFTNCCCSVCDLKHPIGYGHATALIQATTPLHPVAYSVTGTEPDALQAKALKAGALPPKFDRKIDAGAEDAVKLFESSIGDPKVFAATVSDRKDVVLFGSDYAERYAGGKAVAAELLKWNLKLTVRDGLQAGLASPTVAWVAANVDAVDATKPKAPSLPYELLAIYEQTGGAWKLVQANFAFYARTPN